MIAHRKFNFFLVAVSTALLSTSIAWSANPPDRQRVDDRESAGSMETTSNETQTIDQDGNIVSQIPNAATSQSTVVREPKLDAVSPDAVEQVGPVLATDIENESNFDTSVIVASPILDAESSQFSFQALLTDAQGDPLAGPTVDLVFYLYDGIGNLLVEPIGPIRVPITNGIVDTQVPVNPKFFDGTARELGVVVNRGAELTPRVKLVAVPYALRVDRVRSEELDDTIDLGAIDANGQLRIWSNIANQRTIVLQGSTHTVTIIAADGTNGAVLSGELFGELRLRDQTGNNQTALLSATSNSGGQLSLSGPTGTVNIFAHGGAGTIDTTEGFSIRDAIPGDEVMQAFRFSGGAQLLFKDEFGVTAMQSGTSASSGGFMELYQTDGDTGVRIHGDAGTNAGGLVWAYDSTNNATIKLDGNAHQIGVIANNGEDRVRLYGAGSGGISLFDGNGFNGTSTSDQTVFLGAGPDLLAAPIGPGNDFGGQIILDRPDGTPAIFMNGGNSLGNGTRISTTGSHQVLSSISPTATILGSLEPGANGAVLFLRQADGTTTVELDGDAGANSGGDLTIRASDGSSTIFIDGDSGGGGLIEIRDNVSSTRVRLDGESVGTGGEISVMDGSGTETIELLGSELSSGEGHAQIMLRTSAGADRIEIDAVGSSGARLQLFNTNGSAIIMDGEVNGGGRIRVRNADNVSRIFIDGDFSGTGLSRIRADVFRVQGGVDLAEPFECKNEEQIKPGMVMIIDPDSPGKLMMSTEAYDRKVAGIVSGAGGVRPGITLSQEGVMDKGHLVALTGRVYCMADASNGAIQPGDLLTTSNTPGHAMKVNDYSKAQGAVIGKAMSNLEKGKGLILVLVQPQ